MAALRTSSLRAVAQRSTLSAGPRNSALTFRTANRQFSTSRFLAEQQGPVKGSVSQTYTHSSTLLY